MKPKKQWFYKRWFFQGLIVTLPIILTIALLQWVVVNTDSLLSLVLPQVFPFSFPGLGLIVVTTALIAIGALTESVIIQKGLILFKWFIDRLPVVRTIYSTVTQTVQSVVGSNNEYSKVVLVEFPRPGMFAIGFVTSLTSASICLETGLALMNVFIPTSPLPTNGFYLMVPTTQIKPLNITSQEAFQLIISAGIVQSK